MERIRGGRGLWRPMSIQRAACTGDRQGSRDWLLPTKNCSRRLMINIHTDTSPALLHGEITAGTLKLFRLLLVLTTPSIKRLMKNLRLRRMESDWDEI